MTKKKKTQISPIHILLIASIALNIGLLSFIVYQNRSPVDIDVLESYELPQDLVEFREPNIVQTSVPNKSPFGGQGLINTRVTAGYNDPEYTAMFGTQHNAVDIVPTDNYYESMPFFISRKRALVFATHNGSAEYLFDEFGANYLIITNPEESLRTMYVHLEAAYVQTNDAIEAGQIIGVMGNTGNSTGSHLHYAVQIKNGSGYWQYINPLNYIY